MSESSLGLERDKVNSNPASAPLPPHATARFSGLTSGDSSGGPTRRPHDPIGTHADWYATYPQRLTCAACGKATACIHRVTGRCVLCQKEGAA